MTSHLILNPNPGKPMDGSAATLDAGGSSSTEPTESAGAGDVWRQPAKVEIERTREEEFDDYFKDMFL